jgi:hypothetical protein
LKNALEGAGKVHLDFPVESEPMDIEAWEPRRSANDAAPPHPKSADRNKQLQQGILGAALEAADMVPVTVHVEAYTERIDFYFEPDPGGAPAPGLLGQMTRSPSILVFHHEPLNEHAIHDALRRALNLWASASEGREGKKKRKKKPGVANTWFISPGGSAVLQKGWGFEPKATWPAGFHFMPPAFAMAAVTLSDLEVTRDTLLLRLLDTGDGLENALAEQAALPPDAIERRATLAALLAVAPPGGETVSIDEPLKDPVLRACRRIYRRWAERVARVEG